MSVRQAMTEFDLDLRLNTSAGIRQVLTMAALILVAHATHHRARVQAESASKYLRPHSITAIMNDTGMRGDW